MTDGSTPALRLSGIKKAFDGVRALDGLSFDVPAGRFFALFGPSSVGKTTTLRTIAGLERPDQGRILIDGEDVTGAPIRGRGVGMVFQSFALYPHLTVAENFAYPLGESGVDRAEIKTRVNETTEMLRLGHRLDHKPSTLSGGEQQRVALGRALIARPHILLLDEPLTNLDAKLRHDMRAELKRLHRQFGMTIIFATPDELEALSMGEEIGVMEEGRIVQLGTPDELYDQPRNMYVASKIGSPHMNLFEAQVGSDARHLETPFGRLDVPHGALSAGDTVIAGIRPADLKLANGDAPHVMSRVKLVEPLGDLTVVSLATPGPTLRILLSEADAANVRPNDDLAIVVASNRVHLFQRSDGSTIVHAP